tara:strand:+ start:380 stop:658 length:279 start_codon:yes stop_codon:yes gene_type:complete
MNDEEIRQQINDIIEGEIQNGINEYLESQEEEKSNEGGVGFVNNEEGAKQLNVKVSQAEVDRLVKEYKKAMKYRKSNLFQASQLVDKNGNQL